MMPDISVVRSKFQAGFHESARSLSAPIYESWKRCLANDLSMNGKVEYDFLARDKFQELFLTHKLLIACANKHIDTLYKALAGAGWSIMLTDQHCHVLDVWRTKNIGEPKILSAFRQGAVLAENLIGTSAMSCAIASQRLVSVFGEEHYKVVHKSFNCAAIPILDPLNDICGTVDITNEAPSRNPAAFFMLEACARDIQNELVLSIPDVIVLELQPSLSQLTGSSAILAFSYEQKVVGCNAPAQRFFDFEIKSQNVYFDDLFDDPFSGLFDNDGSKDNPFSLNLKGGISIQAKILGPHKEVITNNSCSISTSSISDGIVSKKAKPYFGDPALELSILESLKAIKRLPILLQGESGVGKEVVAKYIHDNSPNYDGKMVSLNCAAIPESLIESELFGYESGAFTGADKAGKIGKIQQADGGTLFLDEIGDMPLSMQTRLLRVLETRQISRLGGGETREVSFQLICATHKDLAQATSNGEFRLDLFYRIFGYELLIPPLRSRSDIRGLAERILDEETNGKRSFTESAIRLVEACYWKGNVRELRNAIVYADTMAPVNLDKIDVTNLPNSLRLSDKPILPTQKPSKPEDMKTVYESNILETIKFFDGNLTKAAKSLGIARSTLYRKIEKARNS